MTVHFNTDFGWPGSGGGRAVEATAEDELLFEEEYYYEPPSASEVAPLTTMAMAMLFGSIWFATIALAVRCAIMPGDYFNRIVSSAVSCTRSSALDVSSFSSIFTFLFHTSVFGFILFYAYLCEYHPPYPHSEKSYDRDEFFFLTALLFVAAFFTWKKNVSKMPPKPKKKQQAIATMNGNATTKNGNATTMNGNATTMNGNATTMNGSDHHDALSKSHHSSRGIVKEATDANEILNRDQTEEWKGWMQYMFLLYHYYHAEEVYNSIRIMITCYVWMTGFGNLSFFYLKADYSAVRVLQMLWRLNFLVLFLCLTQGTTYILYYICLLHTYFFLMVYVTMRIGKQVNYTKYGIRIKMTILAIFIYLVWDVDSGLFRVLHGWFLGERQNVMGAPAGSLWEWYFRSTLDHWSTFLGMIFAMNFPILSLFVRKIEAQPFWRHVGAKVVMGIPLFAAFVMWANGPFTHDKFAYNQTNAYYGFVPLIAYIYFRNITLYLREHTCDLLHQIGKTTLETYLMQHHIWLTSNAKSLLTLIPGWPKMNFLLVTMIYFVASRRLYFLTLFLRGMILPDDRNKCVRNLAVMGIVLAIFSGLAFGLQFLDVLNLPMIVILAMVFGYVLYSIVVEVTIIHPQQQQQGQSSSTTTATTPTNAVDEPNNTNIKHSNSNNSKNTLIRLFGLNMAPMLGVVVLSLLGGVWYRMSLTGAAKIQPLPAECEALINRGTWVGIDMCDETTRGQQTRSSSHVSFLATCTPQSMAHAWGWNNTASAATAFYSPSPLSQHCRFVHRDAKSLQKILFNQTITFVGDSTTRHLYHAMRRQLGQTTAGAYNATIEKWSDFSDQIKKTHVEFEWAPYASDQLEMLQGLPERKKKNDNYKNDDTKRRPDLIVMGGGAWDRLHVYNTSMEQQALADTVAALAKTMKNIVQHVGIPIVWVVPPTINSIALLTEEKRNNIKETHIQGIRELYHQQGVPSAASFVLNGPAFTQGRVAESYDGVHYPLPVYDAGAQILANALDWLIPVPQTPAPSPPHPGAMAHPRLGFLMLCIVFLGLYLFDNFFGVSYLARLFIHDTTILPWDMYDEAFAKLHRHKNKPEATTAAAPAESPNSNGSGIAMTTTTGTVEKESHHRRQHSRDSSSEDENVALLGSRSGGSNRSASRRNVPGQQQQLV